MHHRFIDFFKMYESVVGVFADLASINVLRSKGFSICHFHKKFMIMTFTTLPSKEKLNVKIGTLKKFAHFSLSRQLTDQKTNKALNQNFLLSQKWS